jgi:hypothetical protein
MARIVRGAGEIGACGASAVQRRHHANPGVTTIDGHGRNIIDGLCEFQEGNVVHGSHGRHVLVDKCIGPCGFDLLEQRSPSVSRSRVIGIDDNAAHRALRSMNDHEVFFGHGLHHVDRMRGGNHPARGDEGAMAFVGQIDQHRNGLRVDAVARIRLIVTYDDGVGAWAE